MCKPKSDTELIAASRDCMSADQCQGCYYWRKLQDSATTYCCHYALQMQHSRMRDGDRCLSRATSGPSKEERQRVFAKRWNEDRWEGG